MKRLVLILVLSIVGSLLPSVILAGNVGASRTNSVSLLALDTNKVVQAKNGGITSLFKKQRGTNLNTAVSKQKVIIPKIVDLGSAKEKTSTKGITTSLKEAKTLKKATLPNMVKAWGYNWKTDRKKLANEVGIAHYAGTMKQNSLIKNFLLSKIQIQERAKELTTPDIRGTETQVRAVSKLPVHKTVKYRGYIWEVDREKLANEVGIKNYVGSKEQNLLIKKYLKKKITIKKIIRT